MKNRAAGIFLALLAALVPAAVSGGIVDRVDERKFSVPPHARITVRNTDGRIMIYGSEEAAVHVSALKRAFTEERADAIKVNVELNGDAVVIDTIYPPKSDESLLADRSGTVDYTILVPQFCTMESVELENGEVIIEEVSGGGIKARVERGKLTLVNSYASADLHLGDGLLDLLYAWCEDHGPFRVQAELGKGELRLGLPETAAVGVEAEAPNGRIDNAFAAEGAEGESELKTLRTTIGDKTATEKVQFSLRAANGGINLYKAN